ncbi:hypothetical protein PALB_32140 [Pseudoalteromonas luteoviolacea B = ATCC 29581]|nr:hypothetical protein PALB_32140 [Pseudoalteromonas luteoviolacea B = ATCC 29581]
MTSRFLLFTQYRYKSYQLGVKQLLEHVQQFGLIVIFLFYTAMPGLVMLSFLWLGKVVQFNGQVMGSVFHGWSLLVLQTGLLLTMRSSILGMSFRVFQRSIADKLTRLAVDFFLLLLTHAPLWLSFILLVNMSVVQLSQAKHFIAFITLQLILGVVTLYRPKTVVILLVLSFAMIALPFMVWVCVTLILCGLSSRLHIETKNMNSIEVPSLKSAYGIWAVWCLKHKLKIIWRLLATIILVLVFQFMQVQRPDLNEVLAPLGTSLYFFVWLTLVFSSRDVLKCNQYYWRSIELLKPLKRSFFVLHALVLVFTWFVAVVQFAWPIVLWFWMFGIPVLLYLAWGSARRLALGWCCMLVVSYFI